MACISCKMQTECDLQNARDWLMRAILCLTGCFQERSDKERSCDIWRANYAACKSSVLVYSDSKDIRGTAVFVHPVCQPVSIIKFLRCGLRTLWRDIPRIYRYSLLYERISRKYQTPNTWYLYDLAVKPEYQGYGIASRLLRPMLAYLD